MFRVSITLLAFLLVGMSPAVSFGQADVDSKHQEPAAESEVAPDREVDPATRKLFDKFRQQLDGSALVGSFTTLHGDSDADDKLTKERYEIKGVKKAPNGDYWIIKTRIQYGERDIMLPVPVEVKWAGSTPVITLDKVALPGLGTFGARVVIHDGKYAGTWSHDDVGGHLFGRIEPPSESEATEKKAAGE